MQAGRSQPAVAFMGAVLLMASGAAMPQSDPSGAARPIAPNLIAACANCHGPRGEGNPAANGPRIAGQPQGYLARQLAAYADGRRKSMLMLPISRALNAQQRLEVAAYYAALEAPRAPAAPWAGDAERGRSLAARGDSDRQIPACATCHGAGVAPEIPYLAGLDGKYLVSALASWRDGSRKSDPTGQMPLIGARLSDEDIAALAAYFSAEVPPAAGSPAGSGQKTPTTDGAASGPGPSLPTGNNRGN